MDESDSIVLNDNLALILVIYTVEEITSWRSIAIGFLPVGICLLCVMQWRRLRQGAIAHHIEITTYKTLPLKFVSRLWGNIAGKSHRNNFFAHANLFQNNTLPK